MCGHVFNLLKEGKLLKLATDFGATGPWTKIRNTIVCDEIGLDGIRRDVRMGTGESGASGERRHQR